MSWLLLSIIAAFLWAMVHIIDKMVVTNEFKHPGAFVFVSSFNVGLFYIIVGLFFGRDGLMMPIDYAAQSLFIGLVYAAAILFYISALTKDDVSRVGPLLSVIPFFIIMYSFVVLGERFDTAVYAGIVLMLAGVFVMAFRVMQGHFRVGVGALLAICGAALFATRNVMTQHVSSYADQWDIVFWMGVGFFLFAIFLFLFQWEKIFALPLKTFLHISLADIIAATAFLCYTAAFSRGSFALSTAIVELQAVFLFVMSLVLSRIRRKFLHEQFSRSVLIQKIVGIFLLSSGAVVIALMV